MNKKEIIESNQESPKEISKTYTLFYSFFLIPLMIAFLAAFFFGIFNLLTYEKTTVFDLLDDIEYGSQTKKWQAAYILQTKIPEIKALPIPEYGTFKNRLVKIYKKNKSDLEYCQPETRLYLARLMGGIEDPFYIEYLLDGLDDMCSKCDPDVAITQKYSSRVNAIAAIGQLVRYSKNETIKKNASDMISSQIEEYYSDEFTSESYIAYQAIIALGEIGNPKYKKVLIDILENKND